MNHRYVKLYTVFVLNEERRKGKNYNNRWLLFAFVCPDMCVLIFSFFIRIEYYVIVMNSFVLNIGLSSDIVSDSDVSLVTLLKM